MSALNLALLHWIAAGEDPNSWALLVGRVFALWGGPISAVVLIWTGWKKPSERTYLFAVLAVAVIASLLSHVLASALNVQRPFVLDLVPGYIVHSASGSLPSTHATVMFFVAAALLVRSELRRVGWLLLVLATLTGWSRVYVGVHFPLDIAAGLLLGLFLAGALAAVRWLHSDGFAIRQHTRIGHKRAAASNWRPS